MATWITAMQTVSTRDVAWLAGSRNAPAAEHRVYERYLARHRRHRSVGGALGALFAVIVGIRWHESVSIGIGTGNPLADLLFCTVGGILVGALSAETFHLSEPPSTSITASLVERGALPGPEVVRLSRAFLVVALLTGLAITLTGRGASAVWVAVAGSLIAGFAEATRRAITDRRRPLLSDRAQFVDMRIRSFAAASVSLLELAMAVLTLGWVLSSTVDITNDALILLRMGAVYGSLIASVLLLRRAVPRPPKRWIAGQP